MSEPESHKNPYAPPLFTGVQEFCNWASHFYDGTAHDGYHPGLVDV